MPLPFDGAISKYLRDGAPAAVREAIEAGDDRDILDPGYPYDRWIKKKDYKDDYREGLRKIIDAKIAGEEIDAPDVQEPPKVVDLMEALRRSLDSVSGEKKKPLKADLAKPVAKAKTANGAKKRKTA